MCIAICLPSGSSTSAPGLALERDEHADLAEAGRLRVVHVRHDAAAGDGDAPDPAQLLVLADRRDVARKLVADGAAARIGRGAQRLDIIGLCVERDLRGLAHKILKLLVLGDEVGFWS